MKQKYKTIALLMCAVAIVTMCSCIKDNPNNGGSGGSHSDNGHAYVDLGLPSGTLWATCNVGASHPEDYGSYFAWGETAPKETYSWANYRWCSGNIEPDGNCYEMTKYCDDSYYGHNGFHDNLIVLKPSDDAATANWGNEWRTPTPEEWDELITYTIVLNSFQNNVYGLTFTSANGNSIFFPHAGCKKIDELHLVGVSGYYWANTLNSSSNRAECMQTYLGSKGYWTYGHYRNEGCTVRPVRSSH